MVGHFHHRPTIKTGYWTQKKGQDSRDVKSLVPNMKKAKCASFIEIYIQFDGVSCLFFLLVNHLCIDLCRANIGMT